MNTNSRKETLSATSKPGTVVTAASDGASGASTNKQAVPEMAEVITNVRKLNNGTATALSAVLPGSEVSPTVPQTSVTAVPPTGVASDTVTTKRRSTPETGRTDREKTESFAGGRASASGGGRNGSASRSADSMQVTASAAVTAGAMPSTATVAASVVEDAKGTASITPSVTGAPSVDVAAAPSTDVSAPPPHGNASSARVVDPSSGTESRLQGGGGQESNAAIQQPAAAGASSTPTGKRAGRKAKTSPEICISPVANEVAKSELLGTTMGKRARTTTQPFQSAMVEQIQQVVAVSAREKQNAASEDKVILYDKGEYLALRSETDDFFLCKALQNVHRTSKRIRIQWLDNEGQKSKDTFSLTTMDYIELATILTNVEMRKAGSAVVLPDKERQRTMAILEKAILKEKGKLDGPEPSLPATDLGVDLSQVKANDSSSSDDNAADTAPAKRRKSTKSTDAKPDVKTAAVESKKKAKSYPGKGPANSAKHTKASSAMKPEGPSHSAPSSHSLPACPVGKSKSHENRDDPRHLAEKPVSTSTGSACGAGHRSRAPGDTAVTAAEAAISSSGASSGRRPARASAAAASAAVAATLAATTSGFTIVTNDGNGLGRSRRGNRRVGRKRKAHSGGGGGWKAGANSSDSDNEDDDNNNGGDDDESGIFGEEFIVQASLNTSGGVARGRPRAGLRAAADEEGDIVYRKGDFLAVRNKCGGFYLCKAQVNVYSATKEVKIKWLAQPPDNPNAYMLDYSDVVEKNTILTKVELTREKRGLLSLSDAERRRAQELLNQALRLEQRQREHGVSGPGSADPASQHCQNNGVSSVVQLDGASQDHSNTSSRRKKAAQISEAVHGKSRISLSSTGSLGDSGSGCLTVSSPDVATTSMPGRPDEGHSRSEGRKRKNHRNKESGSTSGFPALVINPNIPDLRVDPLWDAPLNNASDHGDLTPASLTPCLSQWSDCEGPVSPSADSSSRLVAAVLRGDRITLRQLLRDGATCLGQQFAYQSAHVRRTALDHALLRGDISSIRLLLQRKRLPPSEAPAAGSNPSKNEVSVSPVLPNSVNGNKTSSCVEKLSSLGVFRRETNLLRVVKDGEMKNTGSREDRKESKREGNAALLKDVTEPQTLSVAQAVHQAKKFALQRGVPVDVIEELIMSARIAEEEALLSDSFCSTNSEIGACYSKDSRQASGYLFAQQHNQQLCDFQRHSRLDGFLPLYCAPSALGITPAGQIGVTTAVDNGGTRGGFISRSYEFTDDDVMEALETGNVELAVAIAVRVQRAAMTTGAAIIGGFPVSSSSSSFCARRFPRLSSGGLGTAVTATGVGSSCGSLIDPSPTNDTANVTNTYGVCNAGSGNGLATAASASVLLLRSVAAASDVGAAGRWLRSAAAALQCGAAVQAPSWPPTSAAAAALSSLTATAVAGTGGSASPSCGSAAAPASGVDSSSSRSAGGSGGISSLVPPTLAAAVTVGGFVEHSAAVAAGNGWCSNTAGAAVDLVGLVRGLCPVDLTTNVGKHAAPGLLALLAGGGECLAAVCNLLYDKRRAPAAERAVRVALGRRDDRGRAAAHYAAAAPSPAALEWLLSRGVNVSDVDYEGNSPIHLAAFVGRVECLHLLLSLRVRDGASHAAHLDDANRRGQSALHVAIQAEQPLCVRKLLAFGADANKPLGSHSDKVTPLMLAAQRGHRLDLLLAVLERVENIDAQDKRGRSALVHAAMNGHTAAVCQLLRRGACASLADGSGNLALHYAAAYGHLHVVKLLVEMANLSPAQLNDAKMCSLEVAFRKGHIGIVRYMLGLGCFGRGLGSGGGGSGNDLADRLLSACVALPDLLEPTVVARFELLLAALPSLVTKTGSQQTVVAGTVSATVASAAGSVTATIAGSTTATAAAVATYNGAAGHLQHQSASLPLTVAAAPTLASLASLSGYNLLHQLVLMQRRLMAELVDRAHTGPLHLHSRCLSRLLDLILDGRLVAAELVQRALAACNGEGETPVSLALNAGCLEMAARYGRAAPAVLSAALKSETALRKIAEHCASVSAAAAGCDVAFELFTNSGLDADDVAELRTLAQTLAAQKGVNLLCVAVRSADAAIQDDCELAGSAHDDLASWADDHHQLSRPSCRWPLDQIDNVDNADDVSGSVGDASAAGEAAFAKNSGYGVSAEVSFARRRLANACGLLRTLLGLLGMEATGPVLHAAVRCRSPLPLRTILESSRTVPSLHANIEHRQKGLTPLQEAVMQGKAHAALLLVKHGARTDLMMPPCATPRSFYGGGPPQAALPLLLFCCVPGGPLDRSPPGAAGLTAQLIRRIADQKTRDLTAIHPVTGDCALHYVVQKRHWPPEEQRKTVETLLRCGLTPLATNVNQQTPLHLAAASNRLADGCIEMLLVNAGAVADAPDHNKRTPLHYLFLSPAAARDPINVCRLLLQLPPSATTGSGAAGGRQGVAAPARLCIDVQDVPEGNTPLHYASQGGAALCCRLLLQRGANAELRNLKGNTAIGLSVLRGQAGSTLVLIERGHGVSDEVFCAPSPKRGVGADQLVWRYVSPKMAIPQRKSLLQAVFEAGRRARNAGAPWTSAFYAWSGAGADATICGNSAVLCKRDDSPSLSALLNGLPDDASLVTMWNSLIPGILLEHSNVSMTLAVDAAVRAHDFCRALKLLGKVKHSWSLTSQKQTMLHLVAQQPFGEDQLELAQALLDRDVLPQATDEHGCTALTYANINWNYRLAEFLSSKIGLENVVSLQPDRSFRTPLSAIFWNLEREPLPPEMSKLALQLVRASTKKDVAGMNVLSCYPVRNLEYPGTICVSESLLHVENPSAARISPLILAVCKKNYAVARFLLREGNADPNFVDGQQRTALMYAVKLNDISMAKLILNYDYVDESMMIRDLVSLPVSVVVSNDCDRLKSKTESQVLRSNDDSRAPCVDAVNSKSTCDDFVMTSHVKLDHKDIYGWTMIHHVVAPLPEMTYVCTDMLQLLARVGAPLDIPDRNGVIPRHLSAARGVETITAALHDLICQKQNKANDENDPAPKVAYHGLAPIADDGVLDSLPVRDFRKDAEAQRGHLNGAHTATDVGAGCGYVGIGGVAGFCGVRLDPLAGLDPLEWELMRDPSPSAGSHRESQLAYDVLLTKLDVHPPVYWFCKLQVAVSLDATRFVVVERSGRVGDSGGAVQVTPIAGGRADAVREFCRRFRERTDGATFDEVHTLRPTPGKFRPLLPFRGGGSNVAAATSSGPVTSAASKRVAEAVKEDVAPTFHSHDVAAAATDVLDDIAKAPQLSKLAQPLQTIFKSIIKACEVSPSVYCKEDGLKEAESLLEEMRQLAAEKRQLEAAAAIATAPLTLTVASPLSGPVNASSTGSPGKDGESSNGHAQQMAELLLRLAERSHQLHALIPPTGVRSSGLRASSGFGRRKSVGGSSSVSALETVDFAGPEQVEPLWTEEQIDEQMARVQNLEDLQLASMMLRGAAFAATEVHPLDYLYRAVNCRLAQVQGIELQTVLQYIHNSLCRQRTAGPTSVIPSEQKVSINSIYRVSRLEEERQGTCEGNVIGSTRNQWLLWKPVGPGSLLATLYRGLQATPLDSLWRAYLPQHSHGILFYDRFGQEPPCADANYSNRRFALLCQVALGECVDLIALAGNSQTNKGNSALLTGRWAPYSRAHVSWQSYTVPLGETTLSPSDGSSAGLRLPRKEFNEYVVYKPQQVCMRYLVEYTLHQ